MKILSAEAIKALDKYTIDNEPIASLDLMERAAKAFTDVFLRIQHKPWPVHIFCGPGNNGGDGLAIARLLHENKREVHVWLVQISDNTSADFNANLQRIVEIAEIPVHKLAEGDPMPGLPQQSCIIDALFGSGLSRPLEGFAAAVVKHLNEQPSRRFSVDLPSGLYCDEITDGIRFRADHTLTFQLPKLSFLSKENSQFVGKWRTLDIGLSETGYLQSSTDYFYSTGNYLRSLYRPRSRDSYKNTFGHALTAGGSKGSVGAAVLMTRACMRSGAGLTTAWIPECGYTIMQTTAPEAMCIPDKQPDYLTKLPDLSSYNAIGIGPGMGKHEETVGMLYELINEWKGPLVIDADGINILVEHLDCLDQLPSQTILTPHPGEFKRLVGEWSNSMEMLGMQRQLARKYNLILVLKGSHTSVALPDGSIHFNSTGTPALATGGTGDVLTGMITGLLAQGYPAADAARLGVWLHGKAGQLAARRLGEEAVLAGDVIRFLGKAYQALKRCGKR